MKTKLKIIALIIALISFGQTAYVYAKAEQKNDPNQTAQTIVDFINYNDKVKAAGGTVSSDDKRVFLEALKDYIKNNDLTRDAGDNRYKIMEASPGA